MPTAIPTLSFTTLDIGTIVNGTWPAQEAMIRGAGAKTDGPLQVQAFKAMYTAITKAMTIYETEETKYLDSVQRFHESGKGQAQEALRLLAACKEIKPADPNRARLFQGSIDRIKLSADDVEAMRDAVSRWRGDLTAHQGVRGSMTVPATMKELLEDKYIALLEQQYKKMREPLITRMAKEGDSIVKIAEFKKRIDDCLKMATTMSKASGQDANDLQASWQEIRTLVDKFSEQTKFPIPSALQTSLDTLKKNDPKAKATIQMIATKGEPTWVAQIKGARSYIKTIRVKLDNFQSANKDIKTHPVIGKELGVVVKQVDALEKDVDKSADLVEKCQKRIKELKL